MSNAYITGNEIHFISHKSVGPHTELPLFSHGHHFRFMASQKVHCDWIETGKCGTHDDNNFSLVRNNNPMVTLTNGNIDFNNSIFSNFKLSFTYDANKFLQIDNNNFVQLVQPSSSNLSDYSELVRTDDSRLSDSRQCNNSFDNASTSRTNLGLGSIALLNTIDISDNTNLSASNGISLSGDSLSVDLAYTPTWTGIHNWSYTDDTTLTMTSTKDMTLILEADSDNVTESDNPTLIFYQDDRQKWFKIGIQELGNSAYLNSNEDILFQTEGVTRLKISDTQIVADEPIDLNYTYPNCILYTDVASQIQALADGNSGEFLTTNGSGSYSWAVPTDTNTTYTASDGVELDGTNIEIDHAYANTWTEIQTMKGLTLDTGAGLDCRILLKENGTSKWSTYNQASNDDLVFYDEVNAKKLLSLESNGGMVLNAKLNNDCSLKFGENGIGKWRIYNLNTNDDLVFYDDVDDQQVMYLEGGSSHKVNIINGTGDTYFNMRCNLNGSNLIAFYENGVSKWGIEARGSDDSFIFSNEYTDEVLKLKQDKSKDLIGITYIGDGSRSSTRGYEGYLNIYADSDVTSDDNMGVVISGRHNNTFLNNGTSLFIEGANNDGGSETTPMAYYFQCQDENLGLDVIAYTTKGTADGKIRFGGSGTFSDTYRMYVNGSAYATGSWASSDERCKTDIQKYDTSKSLDTILNIKVKSYKYEYFYNNPEWKPQEDRRQTVGFIAQEIENLDGVKDSDMIQTVKRQFKKDQFGENNRLKGNGKPIEERDYITYDDFRDVDKSKLIPHLIGSIQELQKQITELKACITDRHK